MLDTTLTPTQAQALATKRQATALLDELLAAKAAGQSSRDLFAAVTGSSALDNAIADARAMIASADRLLGAATVSATSLVASGRVVGRTTILPKPRGAEKADEAFRVAM
jgi:hypothetical protein